MATVFVFLLGITNFAMHKAVMASSHPLVATMHRGMFGGYTPHILFGLEFAVLLASLAFVVAGSTIAVFAYAGYTALNALGAWIVLSGRF